MIKKLLFLFAITLTAIPAMAMEKLIVNTDSRESVSLNGTWHYIVDPYETGFYTYRYQERGEDDREAYWNRPVARDKSDRLEHGYQDTIEVPGDWNSQSDTLTYRFHAFNTDTGPVKVLAQCLPTHRITSDHPGVRYAISLNGDSLRIVDINAAEYSDAWNSNTLRATAIGVSEHEITEPGLQTVRIWMVDAGVVLDKLTVEIASGE